MRKKTREHSIELDHVNYEQTSENGRIGVAAVYSLFAASRWMGYLPHWQTERIALGGVLLFSLLIRLVWLETVPPNVTADEADNLQVIYRIVAGRGPGLFGLDWKPSPAFSTYVMAAVMSVAGWTIPAMRLTSVVLSTAALIPFYLIARDVTGRFPALLGCLLLASNPWYLNFSRSGWENVWTSLYLLGAMYFLQRGFRSSRMREFVYAGVCCGLSLYGYFAGWLTLPILLICLPVALWLHRRSARTVLLGYAIMTITTLVLYAPQAGTMMRESVSARRPNAVLLVGLSGGIVHADVPAIRDQVATTIRAFFLLQPNLPFNGRYNQAQSGVIDPLVGVLYWIGLVYGFLRWRDTYFWWAMLLFGLVPIQVLTRGAPDGARAVAFAPVMYLFVTLGLGTVARLGRRATPSAPLILALAVAVTALGASNRYATWMGTTELARLRHPAIEVAEFQEWQAAQLADIRAGGGGFHVGQWLAGRRPTRGTGVSAAGTGPPVATVPDDPEPSSALPTGRLTAILGDGIGGARLNDPHGVAADRQGNVYVADTGNRAVLKYDNTGTLLLQFPKEGSGPALIEPTDIDLDASDNVYVVDSGRDAVERYKSDGVHDATLLGEGKAYRPRGIAFDQSGQLYVADTGRSRILRLSPDGAIEKQWNVVDGEALAQPTDVAVDAAGNLYVTDPEAKRLLKLDPAGYVMLRKALMGTSTRDSARIAVTADGKVVLADTGMKRIQLLDAGLNWIATLGEPGLELPRPVGLGLSAGGEVWVADAVRGVVLRMDWTLDHR